ncbi:hypothetical protein LVE49_004552, partial [Salmonella enterica]|nr:hypothetical protein [Salmonella enterica]
EDLKTVWMQIASSLRGIENCNDKILETENDELIEYWQSVILPDLIHKGERALTRDETVLYIQNDCLCKRIKKAIRDDGSLTEQNDINFIAKMISEYAVAENAVIPDYVTKSMVVGDTAGIKWIQSGNIFISVFHKDKDDHESDGERIWQTLNESLIEWNPSYYQIIKSEIQNTIEAEALSFNNHLANDGYGQAGWLNQILNSAS